MALLHSCTVSQAPSNPMDVVRKQDTVLVVVAPSNGADFSMFPGAVAPSSGTYLAIGSDGKVWLLIAGNATWLYGQFGAS